MITVRSDCARQRRPAVAGGIDLRRDAERRQLAVEPLPRLAPHRSPGQALRAVGGGGEGRELAEVGNDISCAHDAWSITINMTLRGRTLFITGASRGIGHAIALRAAADGANIVIAAKTTEPHPKLPGTIHTAAADVEKAGGQALAVAGRHPRRSAGRGRDRGGGRALRRHRHPREQCVGDQPDRHARHADEALRPDAPGQHARHVPLLAEGDSAPAEIDATRTSSTSRRRCRRSLDAKWFAPHVAYTMAKFGMSLCVLGMAEEFRAQGIAVNALWPRTTIDTEAIRLIAGQAARKMTRSPADHGGCRALGADAAQPGSHRTVSDRRRGAARAPA